MQKTIISFIVFGLASSFFLLPMSEKNYKEMRDKSCKNKYAKYFPCDEKEKEQNEKTRLLHALFQYGAQEHETIKKYFENNWKLVEEESLRTDVDCLCATFCTPLYFVAVMMKDFDLTRWLLSKGAQPKGDFETREIVRMFVETDQAFNNEHILNILKKQPKIIEQKGLYLASLLNCAYEKNNVAAQKFMEGILEKQRLIEQ